MSKRINPYHTEIPEPWATAFKNAGMVSPITGDPSMQALSRETGIHPSAISRIVTGRTKRPQPATIQEIAKALGVDFIVVAQWIGLSWADSKPWTPPESASLLTQPQRDLVERLISELTRDKR